MQPADFETLAELEAAGVAVYAERFLYVNGAMQRITGYSRAELLAMHPRDLAAGNGPEERRLRAKDGAERWVRVRERALPAGPILANWTDITEEKQMEEQLNQLLANPSGDALPRFALEQRLEEELARARRYGTPLSAVMFTLDAPQPPDSTQQLITQIKRTIRTCDLLGHWRPEQLLVVAPGLPLTEAAGFAVKLRRFIEEQGEHTPLPLTASLGVAQFLPGESLHNFVTRIGRAMHDARRRGGNRVETA